MPQAHREQQEPPAPKAPRVPPDLTVLQGQLVLRDCLGLLVCKVSQDSTGLRERQVHRGCPGLPGRPDLME